jgi:thiosulfate/3-mercaptopyruvate sulfurtransferase
MQIQGFFKRTKSKSLSFSYSNLLDMIIRRMDRGDASGEGVGKYDGMVTCSNCGHRNPVDSEYCGNCDQELESEESPYYVEETSERLRWVSTQWLEDHLEEDIIILDTQPNVHDYFLAHIPRARYLNESVFWAPLNGIPGKYIHPETIAKNFGKVGLTKDKQVVVYTAEGGFKGWGDGLEQTAMAYSLLRLGQPNVRILNGGMDKWMNEGRETTQNFPDYEETNYQPMLQTDLFLDLEEFREVKGAEDTVIIDTRLPPFFTGEVGFEYVETADEEYRPLKYVIDRGGPWKRNGHIPGSLNFPWQKLVEDNSTFLNPKEEILRKVEEIGATKDKLIVCLGGTTRDATLTYLVLKHLLEFPKVKIFEGGFTEWQNYPELPVITQG